VGPVAVFGASNFPLAFSVAGGDTASALAAGCPVIFKGHEAHPATGEVVAEAILAAIQAHSLDPGVFSFVHGGSRETGQTLVTHPLVRAVGFTGSLHGGRALLDLCVARTEPIPFYGELGSLNPMFIFPEVLAARGAAIAKGWAASLTMGVGQFCTKPGIAILTAGKSADAFADAAAEALSDVGSGVMLTDDIARGFVRGRDAISKIEKVEELASLTCEGRSVAPQLFKTTADVWLSEKTLSEEIFGPYGLIVEASDADEFVSVAEAIPGQLTCTLHLDDGDLGTAAELVGTLERKAGRLLVNGFPTGVEVGHAMVHGGPYPATTNFGHTSVGSLSIRRWLRPVCYQNFPDALLPPDLRGT